MITWSSLTWEVRQKGFRWYWWVIPLVHVSNHKIKNFVTAGLVVNKLTKLGRKTEDRVRLVAVEITKEDKLGKRKPHL